MRIIKTLFRLHTEGLSKRQISLRLSISRNTVSKYITFFSQYKLTSYEVDKLTHEELHRMFLSGNKAKSKQLQTLEQYFPILIKK